MVRTFQVAFWCAAAFAFVMAVLPHPPNVPFEFNDKVQHMAAFATLGALGTFAYPRLSPLSLAAGLCAFGAVIEIVQLIPVLHRDAQVSDWLADTAAIVVVIMILRAIARWRANTPE